MKVCLDPNDPSTCFWIPDLIQLDRWRKPDPDPPWEKLLPPSAIDKFGPRPHPWLDLSVLSTLELLSTRVMNPRLRNVLERSFAEATQIMSDDLKADLTIQTEVAMQERGRSAS